MTPDAPLAKANDERLRTEVLRRRAEILAQEPVADGMGGDERQFVEFLLAGEYYGIETVFVREVYPLRELTDLPGTPPFLRGIINIRSSILPVIDIKKYLGLPDIGLSDLNKIIIVHSLEQNPMQLGILADAILGVRGVKATDIQTTLVNSVSADCIHGIVLKEHNERLILLDLAAILTDARIVVDHDIV